MSRHPAHLLVSAAAWLGFVAITVWTMAFLAGVVVPRTVDGPDRTTTARAVAIDLALLLFFAVQHSVMARRQVKSWLSRRIPPALERTSFVLATDICLALLLWLWQPWGGQIWHVDGAVMVVAWALFAAGWALAIAATFAIDHLELVGLRQAGWAAARDPGSTTDLYVGGLYAVVRHPMMTGMLLAFWATPQMGASHLLFALAATGYIAIGVRFEERDLRRTFGASYDDYAARVPSLLPRLPIRRRAQGPRARTAAMASASHPLIPATAPSGRGVIAHRWTGEDVGHILEQLQPPVERTAGDHVERDVGIAVVDPFPSGAAGDDWEDDHPEAVDEPGLDQRPAQGEAADRA